VTSLRESREKLLWALPHEIPAQVAVDDDGRIRVYRGLASKRALQGSDLLSVRRAAAATALAARGVNGQTACLGQRIRFFVLISSTATLTSATMQLARSVMRYTS
jgi:hypothetical protein